jgi:hypothetical protein
LLATSESSSVGYSRVKTNTDAELITEKREGRFVPMLLAIYAWIVLSGYGLYTRCEMSTQFRHLYSSKLPVF